MRQPASQLDADYDRRTQLAAFVRDRRDHLRPQDVGLPDRGRRRVSGLRREEVASLASVSVSWYSWLEQGRPITMSGEALDAVARALRLDGDERRYLRHLAGPPVMTDSLGAGLPSADVLGLLDCLMPAPAHVVSNTFELVARNEASMVVFDDDELGTSAQSNTVKGLFTSDLRRWMQNWDDVARDTVARLRFEASKHPDDSPVAQVIDDLLHAEPEFRRIWGALEVRSVVGQARLIDHPTVGLLRTGVVQLHPAEQPELSIIVHRPMDSESAARLRQLVPDHTG